MAIRPPINMKQLIAFIRKEFYHVFRDRRTLLILFGIPIAQIILFGQALSSEVKNIGIAVLDEANNTYSQEITHRLQASPYFKLKDPLFRYDQVEDQFKRGTIKAALIFPPDFGKDLYTPSGTSLQLITDGSDPNTAKTVQNYFSAMVASYQQELNPTVQLPYQITVENRMLYNEEQNGSMNFVPGVIALVFMIVSTALTSVAVVREKELGTMEILLVSPFKPIMILIAKAVPYLILSLINFTVILLLSVYMLDVPIRGNLLLLYAESTLFIIICLSLGLLISTVTASQQTAMLIAMMGMMLPTAFFTGFMFPIENMPLIFQGISKVFPSSYYYSIVKKVMLKGLDFSYIWKETLILIAMAIVFLSLAMKKFKIRLQ
ncbi:ABC transporter permease [Capnocytophaga genosp. AHN8471]|uniref:ABC transporter permease n=1 Tax=Capnocytophaga genosp. AHN8471 TaxID=327574 RepID=A0ABS1YTX6_9FLAO|nr:ABC transporter permease [Capnocytophaga genosp. AHN8471]MBM0649871.1 ABC transporter permease [Capnocytophaga genosp. AHN8471]MBM0662397.1 ABC transporter permease [Capnocytophaga genosp. AHN8471]